MRIAVEINGAAYEGDVEPRTLLSDFIRHDAGLTGTHVGCEHGVCGACTVQIDGETVRACLMLAVQANGRSRAAPSRASPRPRRRCTRCSARSTSTTRSSAASARRVPARRSRRCCASSPTRASARSARRSPGTSAAARATRGS